MNYTIQVVKMPKIGKITIPWAVLHQACAEIQLEIKKRTDSGVDVDGKEFEPYSKSYLNSKSKSHKASTVKYTGGKTTSRVTLRDTGKMLTGIKIGKEGNYSTVYVMNEEQRARIGYWHQTGAGHNPIRKWFGVSKTLSTKVYKNIKTAIMKQVNNDK